LACGPNAMLSLSSQQALNQSGQFGSQHSPAVPMSTMYKQFGGTTTIESSESESEDDTTNFDHLFGSSVCGTVLYSCLLDLAFVVRSEKKKVKG